MSTNRYLCPIDQPMGTFRLLDWLESNFQSDEYNSFKCQVAFAKIKPFYKLHESIQKWNLKGNCSEIIVGIDHKGTSFQALQYALANFDFVNIIHARYSTFHPKLYIFCGETKATAYYGSSNFTTGGLETNFEGGIIVDFELPKDQGEFNSLLHSYSFFSSPDYSCITRLSASLLTDLKTRGFLLDESVKGRSSTSNNSTASNETNTTTDLSNGLVIKPARSIPKNVMTAAAKSAGIIMKSEKNVKRRNNESSSFQSQDTVSSETDSVVLPVITDGFVIQVIPHHNGEILLSKMAIDQNRPFFGFPFTGQTVPKKIGNPTYPQRVPDPIVNIGVYNKSGELINSVAKYPLNTIYYTKKSEIRITITPSILAGLNVESITTNYPILVMKSSSISGCDYDLDFYEYGSSTYEGYLAICNQTLPSGGKPVPRKMGWI